MNKSKYTIYGRETCRHCREAARYLNDKNIAYTYVHVDDEEFFSVDDLKELITVKAPGAKTLPIIFIDDKWIGGKTEMINILEGIETIV